MSVWTGLLQPPVSALLTGEPLRDFRRNRLELKRRITGQPHRLTLWLRADDPQAFVLLQILPDLVRQLPLETGIRLLHGSDADTCPEPQRQQAFALDDARRQALRHGLMPPGDPPDARRLAHAERLLLAVECQALANPLSRAREIMSRLWQPAAHAFTEPADAAEHVLDGHDGAHTALAGIDAAEHGTRNRQAQRRAGHYASAALHYGGEWYVGLDRLEHLRQRLAALGLGTLPAIPLVTPDDPSGADVIAPDGCTLQLFFSFRSPYSWLALDRVRELADRHQLPLRLRPVLPMVMRGLPVPAIKRRYILLDAKREADRHGIPFGRICDPVGAGVERCMAVCHAARASGRDLAFASAAARRIWSEGEDMTRDAPLLAAAHEAGMSTGDVDAALKHDDWREAAERHRADLFDAGLWGVPGLVLNRHGRRLAATWGQDRLWVITDTLQQLSRETRHD